MRKSALSIMLAAAVVVACAIAARAEILVGVAAPLTGPNAAFGALIQKGTEFAAESINAAGGLNGEPIRIILGDDASDPAQGVALARKFAADGVKFVIGHFTSSTSIPASDVYAENDILMITPSSTAVQLTERGLTNVFRTIARDDRQADTAANYLLSNFRGARIAIVHDGTAYGRGLADRVKATLNGGGVSEALFADLPIGGDPSNLAAQIEQTGATVVFYGGESYVDAGLLLRQVRERIPAITFMAGDSIATPSLPGVAGDAVDGVLMPLAPDPRLNPAAAEVVERFRAAGFEPESYTLYAYAALQVIAEAAERAGSNDPQKVAATLRESGPWPTVLGSLSFDEKGDVQQGGYIMYEWKKGPDGAYSYFAADPPICCAANPQCDPLCQKS